METVPKLSPHLLVGGTRICCIGGGCVPAGMTTPPTIGTRAIGRIGMGGTTAGLASVAGMVVYDIALMSVTRALTVFNTAREHTSSDYGKLSTNLTFSFQWNNEKLKLVLLRDRNYV